MFADSRIEMTLARMKRRHERFWQEHDHEGDRRALHQKVVQRIVDAVEFFAQGGKVRFAF